MDALFFSLLAALATVCGWAISRRFPWSMRARGALLPGAFAIGLGPFLAGLGAVAALGLLRGAGPGVHAGFVGLLLAAGAATAAWRPRMTGTAEPVAPARARGFRIALVALLGASVTVLVLQTRVMPLIQHDGLEYATVGRLLFEARDLAAYPALARTADGSGFYGPWTHPPLYPALVHLAYCLQGHAELPGLMRWIAPWCFVGGLVVTWAMGRMWGAVAGLLAAAFYATTPLLFLSASSGLVDPVAVLGMGLVLATLLALEGAPVGVGLAQGVTLGLALWTHSQALLFPVLFAAGLAVRPGFSERRRLAIQAGTAFGAALILGAWPYVRNLAIYGSVISDRPDVFALPELDFPGYFRMNRSVDHPCDQVQYGLLKGWFACEAYAALFWFALAAGILVLRRSGLKDAVRRLSGARPPGPDSDPLLIPLAILLCYHAGIAASILLGLNQMIRTERYLMVTIPGAALLAACGGRTLLEPPGGTCRRFDLHSWARAGLLLLLVLQLGVIGSYGRGFFRGTDEERLGRWPAYGAIEHLNRSAPPGSLVLALNVSHVYHCKRRMLSYHHPRMVSFYRERDAGEALRLLRELGLTHVLVADASLPPAYHAPLLEILARPDLSRLEYSASGHQVYRLGPRPPADVRAVNLVGTDGAWSRTQELIPGGRKRLFRLLLSEDLLAPGQRSTGAPIPVFLREQTSVLRSPRILVPAGAASEGEGTFVLDLEGDAFVEFSVLQYDASGAVVDSAEFGGLLLSPARGPCVYPRRYRFHPAAREVEVRLEHRGRTSVTVRSFRAGLLKSGE